MLTKRSIADKFEALIRNLRTQYDEKVKSRRRAITKRLNQDFWGSDSEADHSRYIGSYGRGTEIKGASDVDLLFRLPYSVYSQYNSYLGNGQSALLQTVRNSVRKTYSSTDVGGDGQVVVVRFLDGIKFEILPAFRNDDGSYTHPDSNGGGLWKKTDPVSEIDAINSTNALYNKKVKHLARMARAWKSKNSVPMGGLLIDTIVYSFMAGWEHRNNTSFLYYDWMMRDFFKYLSGQNASQNYWYVPGSNQRVNRSGTFEYKAGQAHKAALEAIDYEERDMPSSANEQWKKIYGSFFTG